MRLPDGEVDLTPPSQYRPFRSVGVTVEWALETLFAQAQSAPLPCFILRQITKPAVA